MKTIKCIIVDDEPQARRILDTWLSAIPGWQIVRSCANAMEAYETLHSEAIDVMFLDIRMPVITGNDFLRSLSQPPLVVFTTAYHDYALEGYELNVADYLLKPISLQRLLQTVDKLQKQLAGKSDMRPQKREYFFVKETHRLRRVTISEILFIEGMQNYGKIFLTTGVIITNMTLKSLEDLLPVRGFIRVHKSFIVTLPRIDHIEANMLKIGEHTIPIGATYKQGLIDRIGEGNGED